MWGHLKAQGIFIGKNRVVKLMRELDLVGRHRRAYKVTTIQGQNKHAIPDLVKRVFGAGSPNQIWVGDITYVNTTEGWTYTATVIDLYSRKVVGYAQDTNMRTGLVIKALRNALIARGYPQNVIFHSDRGSQYTSKDFGEFCKLYTVRQSMGRAGTCFDNAVAESFFATFKKELIHTRPWKNLEHLTRETFKYIELIYNKTRRHSYLGYLTPHEFELGYRNVNELAA